MPNSNTNQTASEEKREENSLDGVDTASKHTLAERINDFVKLTEPITRKRRETFNVLLPFALEDDQWTGDEEDQRDGDPILTFNHSGEYVERYMSRLFPRNSRTGIMELGVKVYEDDEKKANKYEQEILDRYKEHGLITTLLEQGINYLAGGAGCLYYPKNKYGEADIISLDPTYVHLGWQSGKLVQMAFKEFYGTKFKIHYWDISMYVVLGLDGKVEHTKANEAGFIPFSWVPNFPKPHKHEGRSKVLSIFDLDREFNFRASDYSKRISDNTEAMLAVMSDKIKDGSVERGKKKILYMGQGDDAKYLFYPEEDNVINWLGKVEEKIRKKLALADTSAVQSGVSGKSLAFQFSDLLDLIGFMRVFWDQAFRDLNTAILSYKFGYDVKYKTDPVYQPVLTQDSKSRIEEVALMIENGLMSRKDGIDELRGAENAEAKLVEILAERKKFKPEEKEKKPFEKKQDTDL